MRARSAVTVFEPLALLNWCFRTRVALVFLLARRVLMARVRMRATIADAVVPAICLTGETLRGRSRVDD